MCSNLLSFSRVIVKTKEFHFEPVSSIAAHMYHCINNNAHLLLNRCEGRFTLKRANYHNRASSCHNTIEFTGSCYSTHIVT